MNTPTPETDAFQNKLISRGFPVCAFGHKDCEDSLDFARKLERERDEARATAKLCDEVALQMTIRLHQVADERDQLRKELEDARRALSPVVNNPQEDAFYKRHGEL